MRSTAEAIAVRNIEPDYYVRNGFKYRRWCSNEMNYKMLNQSDEVTVTDNGLCKISGHRTTGINAVIEVEERDCKGNRNYLCDLSYCEDCGRYYIKTDDFDILYNEGRPIIMSRIGTEDGLQKYDVTSGNEFNREMDYLEKTDKHLSNKISELKRNNNYCSKYAVGDYQDMDQLSFYKTQTYNNKYLNDSIKEYEKIMLKPYKNSVICRVEGKEKKIYIGSSEYVMENGEKVINESTELGRGLMKIGNNTVMDGISEYNVELQRIYDIENGKLFGYKDFDFNYIDKTQGIDEIFAKVYSVLKRTRGDLDILMTINKDQDKIIDAPEDRNLIVQGCAGSGKTSVMIQRLASMKTFGIEDFEEGNIILTPGEEFNLFIRDTVENKGIGSIERCSVEHYYLNRLKKCSPSWAAPAKVAKESAVKTAYVEYIYSDRFLEDLHHSYTNKANELCEVAENLNKSVEAWGEKNLKINTTGTMNKVVDGIKRVLIRFSAMNSQGDARLAILTKDQKDYVGALSQDWEKYSFERVFKETFVEATKTVKESMDVKSDKGVHRYDLYAMLWFAEEYFGNVSGSDKRITIDEGQELALNEYRLLKKINDKAVFDIYGDIRQLTNERRGIDSWDKVREVLSADWYVLNKNYRNTNQITKFCNDVLNMQIIRTGLDGSKVITAGIKELKKHIPDKNGEQKYTAIIVATTRQKNEFLKKPPVSKKILKSIGDDIEKGKIVIKTVDEVKGMEFDKVFALTKGMTENMKYVAFTRALKELVVIDK